jgi:hypothetical protein
VSHRVLSILYDAEQSASDFGRFCDGIRANDGSYKADSGGSVVDCCTMPARRLEVRLMKKLKHEAELFKAALLAGVQYAEGRKAVEFEASDSASDKALYVYRLLVHDKLIAPMPEDQVAEKTIRHRLATWYAHQLPEGHPLLR